MRRLLALLLAACTTAQRPAPLPAATTAAPIDAAPIDAAPIDAAPPPAIEPRHAVFSLADNRLLAHVLRGGGLVVLPGRGGLAKYRHFGVADDGWRAAPPVEGRRVARLDGRAALDVPLSATQAAAARAVTVHLLAGPRAGSLELRVGGRRAGRVALVPGWQVASVPVGPGLLVAGENALELRGRASVEWLQVGGAPPATGEALAHHDPADDALLLPEGGGLAYYVLVPAGARLAGAVSDGCSVTVRAGPLLGALAGAAAELDLAPLGGEVVRLELTAAGCPLARLTDAALTLPGPAPSAHRAPPPRNVVVWVMDAVRADRVPLFSPGATALVPGLERLAKGGAVFRTAYSQGNSSQTSHASIFTGEFPARHRVLAGRGGEPHLPESAPTLGESLAAAGLYATGVSANGYVIREAGYARGFAAWRNLMHEPDASGSLTRYEIPATELYQALLGSLAGHETAPFLAFVGTIDNHIPWVAREPWISTYDPGPYSGAFERRVHGGNLGIERGGVSSDIHLSARDLRRIFALYDCGVSFQDQQVGRLLDRLEEWGVLDETLVVVTSDHGEEIFEDGYLGHGASLREVLVHVPLLVYYPPLIPPSVVDEGADGVDILPTILDALGLPIPPEVQGESLAPLAQGVGRGYPRPAVSSQHENAWVMRLDRWKMRVTRRGEVTLWDLVADPAERTELQSSRPLEVRFLTDALSTFLVHQSRWRKSAWGVASNMTAQAAVDLDP